MTTPCTTAGDLVARAASVLNDAAYERWTQVVLLDYATEALRTAYALRPDGFIERRVIQLVPGTAQKAPQEVAQVLTIDMNVVRLPNGDYVEQQAVVSQDPVSLRLAATVTFPAGCFNTPNTACSEYSVRAAQVSSGDARAFFVFPAVPFGCNPEVTATVIAVPTLAPLESETCLQVKSEAEAAIVEWVLYRAFGTDTESAFSAEAAQRHLRNFYTLLDGGLRAASRINADANQRLPIPSAPTVRYAPLRVRQ